MNIDELTEELEKRPWVIVAMGFASAASLIAHAMTIFGESQFISQNEYEQQAALIGEAMKENYNLMSFHMPALPREQKFDLDFTRPRIEHQVTDRKPKHLVKKIIH